MAFFPSLHFNRRPCISSWMNKVDDEVHSRLIQVALDLAHQHRLAVRSPSHVTAQTSIPERWACWRASGWQTSLVATTQLLFRTRHRDTSGSWCLSSDQVAQECLSTCQDLVGWSRTCDQVGSFHLLQEFQLQEGLKFAKKFSLQHIRFQQHKMKVKKAAQTLSAGVTDTLEFLALEMWKEQPFSLGYWTECMTFWTRDQSLKSHL